jgi:two-component system phosphate regulon response regulator PhoB
MQTILLVDDDPQIRQLVRFTLEVPAYHILEARNGTEALELARHARPALIVMDWMMPGLSGVDVLRMLRQHPITAQIPVIMCTGRASETAHELSGTLHPTAYLVKPLNPLELLDTVQAVLAVGAAERR